MDKAYNEIVFHNDQSPDLDEINMNAISHGLSVVDDRVIQLKGDLTEIDDGLKNGARNIQKRFLNFRQGNINNGVVTEGKSVWMFSQFVSYEGLISAFCENGYIYRVHGYDENYNYIDAPKASNTTGEYKLPTGYAYFIFQIATSNYSYDITARYVYDNFYVNKSIGYERIDKAVERSESNSKAIISGQRIEELAFSKGWVMNGTDIDKNSGLITQKIRKKDIAYITIKKGYVVRQISTDAEHESQGARIQYTTTEDMTYIPMNVRANMNDYPYLRISIKNSAYQDIKENEARNAITIVMNTETPSINIPDYFVSQCDEAIKKVNLNMREGGKDSNTFIFISDVHWSINNRKSPSLVKYLLKDLSINNVICNGDIIENGLKENMTNNMSDFMYNFKFLGSDFKMLFGNHDTNTVNTTDPTWLMTKDEFYGIAQKQMEGVHFGERNNFYFDDVTTKTRFICVDTGENGGILDGAQITWVDELCNTDYRVIVIGHLFWQTDHYIEPARNLFEILDYHNNVKAIFTGHVHKDMVDATPNGIPIVFVDCDAKTTIGDYPNVDGTKDEQAFDIVTVDYKNNVIKCVRIGRGVDRIINMKS